jgi:hypothetical protein
VSAKVTVTKDRTKQLAAALKALVRDQVLVGIPSGTAGREPDPENPEPINNATLGYILESGSPAANIPSRPHLKPGVAAAGGQIADRYKKGAKALIDGKIDDVEAVHTAVGILAENSVKGLIDDGNFAPLAERTLAARRARGRTSTKPLVDTGAYRNAITHVVRPKKG